VNVSPNAPASVTNQAAVSGGGSFGASATDPTTVDALPRYANPLAFATTASVVGGTATTVTITYTSDNGPTDINNGQVKIDNCYLAWDSSGNIRLYGAQNGYSDATGVLGQSASLWAGNCAINLMSSTLSTPAANPKALVLSLSVVMPEQDYLATNNNNPSPDFIGPHEVYAWGYNAGGLSTGQVDLGSLIVSQGQDFTLTLGAGGTIWIPANSTINVPITATGLNGFTGNIALGTQTVFGSGCFSVTAPSSMAANTQATIAVRNVNCVSGADDLFVYGSANRIYRIASNSAIALGVPAAGDFTLAVGAPSPAVLTPQGYVAYTVTVSSVNGQSGCVSLSLSDTGTNLIPPLPYLSYSFSPQQVCLSGGGSTQTSTLTLRYLTNALPGGTYQLQAGGLLGGASHAR
jgi:hypothetical protein